MRDLLLHIRLCRLTKDKVPDSLKSTINLLKSNINQLKSSIKTLKSNTDQPMSNTDAQKSTIDSPMSNTRAHMIKAILTNCAQWSAIHECRAFVSPFGVQSADPSGNAMPPSGTDLARARWHSLRAQTRSLMSPSGDIGRPVGAGRVCFGSSPAVPPSGDECHMALACSLRCARQTQIIERQSSLALADKPSLSKGLLTGVRWTSKSCEANPAGDSLWGTTLGRVDNPELWHSLTSAISAVTPVATDWSLVTSALGGNNPVLDEYSVLTSARY